MKVMTIGKLRFPMYDFFFYYRVIVLGYKLYKLGDEDLIKRLKEDSN